MKATPTDVQRVRLAVAVLIRKVDRSDPIGIAAEEIGVSRRQLERHFRSLGTSPHKELKLIRAQLAAAELTSREGRSTRLLGVARRVGLTDERRLREAVSGTYGVSPRELRRAARIDRNLRRDEAIRRTHRGSKTSAGLWSDYRRRRNRAILLALLKKATPEGARAIVGEGALPRPCLATRAADQLADRRVRAMVGARQQPWRTAA